MDQNEPRYGYMCHTDWDWELGEAKGGTVIYASIADLESERTCVQNCGIVKVKVTLEKVEKPGKAF